jgi:hypothetical protein
MRSWSTRKVCEGVSCDRVFYYWYLRKHRDERNDRDHAYLFGGGPVQWVLRVVLSPVDDIRIFQYRLLCCAVCVAGIVRLALYIFCRRRLVNIARRMRNVGMFMIVSFLLDRHN